MIAFSRSKAGIVSSNPTQGMNVCVCVYSVFVLSLRRADHSSKESYRLCKKHYETEEESRVQQRAVEPLMNELLNDYNCVTYVISVKYALSSGKQ
jgi:hypothetical protein